MKKFLAALLAAVMAMGLVTACGGSEEATEETAVVTEDGKSAAIADGVLTVGTNAEFPPFEYVNDAGEPDGFDIALIKAIGEKLGVEVVVENMEFASLVSSIGSKIDVSIAGMTVTEERLQSVDFSDSYAKGVQVVIVKEGSAITSVDDLFAEGASNIVGVQTGTTGDLYSTWDLEDAGLATVERFNKGADAVLALTQDKVDCVVIDNEPAKEFVAANEGLVILDTEYAVEDYAICFAKDSELTEKVNGALQELIADGTVQAIIDKYISAE